ncbi:TerD family protein, partial [Salmonella enterica]|nr:TerD family protein [Salmonella enterica]
MAHFDLSEYASTETAMIFGKLYCHGTKLKLKVVVFGYSRLARQHQHLI